MVRNPYRAKPVAEPAAVPCEDVTAAGKPCRYPGRYRHGERMLCAIHLRRARAAAEVDRQRRPR